MMIIGRRGHFTIKFKDGTSELILAWDYLDAMRIADHKGNWSSIREGNID